MSKKKPDLPKAEVDIEPSRHEGTWPQTKPNPRPYPFAKQCKLRDKDRILILPGKIDYDPAMADVEREVRNLMRKADVTIVVHDYYRGIGEMMARRNGLDYTVVNVDNDAGTELPTPVARDVLNTSVSARRRLLSKCDRILAVKGSPFLDKIKTTNEKRPNPVEVKLFKAKYHDHLPPHVNAVPTSKPTKKAKRK